MNEIQLFLEYLEENWINLLELTYQHILMVFIGVALALIVGIPLGILSTKSKSMASVVLAIANVIQVIPSLALLAVLMIFFGLGFKTVVIGLFLYSLLPIIRNTYVGLKEVDNSLAEVGDGMGMTGRQILLKVRFPLSLPFLLAGARIAFVIAVGLATLAPFIGGDGLGREILAGIHSRDPNMIYGGAIIASLLAILIDFILGKAQKRLETSEH